MEITKLVLLFNKDKIILGVVASILGFTISGLVGQPMSYLLIVVSGLILVNIMLALFASYKLYDQSNLYKPEKLFSKIKFNDEDQVIFLHASFDPISRNLEKLIPPTNLRIYNLYGNRHEDEKSIEVSNRVFPPHPKQVDVDPTKLTDDSKSIDYVLAITSAHEILTQDRRVQFFKEAKRVLKDDGTLILCEQMRNWINFLFFNIGAFHFVSFKNWEDAINASGMRITKEEKLTRWGTILYIQK